MQYQNVLATTMPVLSTSNQLSQGFYLVDIIQDKKQKKTNLINAKQWKDLSFVFCVWTKNIFFNKQFSYKFSYSIK